MALFLQVLGNKKLAKKLWDEIAKKEKTKDKYESTIKTLQKSPALLGGAIFVIGEEFLEMTPIRLESVSTVCRITSPNQSLSNDQMQFLTLSNHGLDRSCDKLAHRT